MVLAGVALSCNKDETVVIGEDGKASGGHFFSAIDEENFYLDHIKYTIVDSHLEVTGFDEMELNGAVKIPPKINFKGNNYEVLKIGEYAFQGCESLTSITLPNSITYIGNRAFDWCTGLTSITIPNSVTIIEMYAFRDCTNLTSITIPNSVTRIGEAAFNGCESLTSITIPNSVTKIEVEGFLAGCDALSSIVVENGNPVYDSRENCNAIIETESNTLIAGCKNTTIPNSVTEIGNYAFFACENLTSITIPNSIITIGWWAFQFCESLTSVTIPNSVTSIGEHTFSNCI